MRKKAVLLAIVFGTALAGAGYFAWRTREAMPPEGKHPSVARYFCPMHPAMVSDTPRDCPICSMRMVPMEEAGPSAEPPVPAKKRKIVWRSPMNPSEVSDRPGKDSMGMDMVPVEVEEREGAVAGPPIVEGRAAVRIPRAKQQLVGVRTAPVARSPFRRTIRTVGHVTFDETRLHHVHTKIGGFVERLYANATGQWVERGQPLLEIYSPELLASQHEYLIALEARDRTPGSPLPGFTRSNDEIVASARRRLELFDVSEDQIRELERTRRAKRTVTLHAPVSGVVLERNVSHGEKVEPETKLLDLVDLSRVWVLASVYEYELPFVRLGQRATLQFASWPGRTFQGTVTFVYPILDAPTRTARLRLEFPNPALELKPGMYGDVLLEADLGERLSVPAEAVIETGTRSLVFVDRGEGLFEPRAVRIGLRAEETYEVLEGLAEGETVVVSGNFLVDSESRLKAALAALPQGPAVAPAGQAGPPGHAH